VVSEALVLESHPFWNILLLLLPRSEGLLPDLKQGHNECINLRCKLALTLHVAVKIAEPNLRIANAKVYGLAFGTVVFHALFCPSFSIMYRWSYDTKYLITICNVLIRKSWQGDNPGKVTGFHDFAFFGVQFPQIRGSWIALKYVKWKNVQCHVSYTWHLTHYIAFSHRNLLKRTFLRGPGPSVKLHTRQPHITIE